MSATKQKRKIVVYSHDTYGLGNIRRMLVISQALIENNPNVSVLILSGSPMLHAFRIPPRIDYIKLPCLARSSQGEYSAKFLDIEYEQILRLRSNLILSSVLDFDPDLLLVDKKPFGVSDELSTTLNELQRLNHRGKRVLLLRDILDSSESTIRIWQKNGYHHAVQRYYDQLLVVGTPDVFDLNKEYRFPHTTRQKVRFCGYLAREAGRRPITDLRRAYGITDEKLVLLTPGGGEDGYHLVTCYLEGLLAQPVNHSVKTLIICGPEMGVEHTNHIKRLAEKCPNAILENFTDDMMACMEAADLVISMGGYNTICELLTLGKRAIVVPRITPVQEQWIRAERMEKLGLLRAIHPEQLTASLLLTTIAEELARPEAEHTCRYRLNLKGLSGVCDSIYHLLDQINRPSRTAHRPLSSVPSKSGYLRAAAL